MAVLALAAAGAWLAPAGYAAIGWTIGSAIGQAMFSKKQTITQEGPRLSDLSVQTSTDGAPLISVSGSARAAGNVIWTAGIKEAKQVDEQEVGGKGGGGTTVSSTTYSYSCSFAISLCKGPIVGITRIWADGKIIYRADNTATVDDIAALDAIRDHLRIYLGDETQLPDPVMEAHKGVGNVPAYRGQAYLVFEDLPLANYGNRVPNISVEIVANGTSARFTRVASWTPPSASMSYDQGTLLIQSFTNVAGQVSFVRARLRYYLAGDLLEKTEQMGA